MRPDKISAWYSSNPTSVWKKESIPTPYKQRDLSINITDTLYQTWDGFGGCFNELGWEALKVLSADKRESVMKEFFHPTFGCKFTFCRMPIGASDFATSWYSLNETPDDFAMKHFTIDRDNGCLIPYIKNALKYCPDLKLFASPWSPPTWLKRPAVYNFGKLIWKKEYLTAYALYFVKFIQAYKAIGVTIDQLHVQNEVVADQKFPSCLWSGEELRDFIRDYMGPAFKRHGITAEIWLGTLNTDDYNGYTNTVLSDPKARHYVKGVAYQWNGKGAVQRHSQGWPNVPMVQSENECGDGKNTWDYALYVFNLMQHYISNGVNGYTYWNMVLATGGDSTWGWKQNSLVCVDPVAKKVIYNPEFYVFKHFTRFIPPGSVRIGLEGPMAGNSVAFKTPDNQKVVVVNNPFSHDVKCTIGAGASGFMCTLKPKSVNTICVD